jgi:hypothetical protein
MTNRRLPHHPPCCPYRELLGLLHIELSHPPRTSNDRCYLCLVYSRGQSSQRYNHPRVHRLHPSIVVDFVVIIPAFVARLSHLHNWLAGGNSDLVLGSIHPKHCANSKYDRSLPGKHITFSQDIDMGEFEGDHCRQTQQGPRNEFGCIASKRCINQEDSHHR